MTTRTSLPDMRNFIVIQSVVAVVLQVVISSLSAAGLPRSTELRQAKEGVGVDQLATAVFD